MKHAITDCCVTRELLGKTFAAMMSVMNDKIGHPSRKHNDYPSDTWSVSCSSAGMFIKCGHMYCKAGRRVLGIEGLAVFTSCSPPMSCFIVLSQNPFGGK
jgi:hypothetical protein